MPTRTIRGAHINYEVLGDDGPWVAVSPGGRRSLTKLQSFGERLAKAGHRVLLHDRRNCGASDIVIDPSQSESQIWADDLYALLGELDVSSAWVGGSSSGCRMSLVFALDHPEMVTGLLLWQPTGGDWAIRRLAQLYYGQYVDAAQRGGMEAVCDTEHFRDVIGQRPLNGERLLAMDPGDFMRDMSRWRDDFLASVPTPLLGLTAEQLGSVTAPACVVPGHDNTHSLVDGRNAHDALPNSEMQVVFPEHQDVDVIPFEEWGDKEAEVADIFLEFMRRTETVS